MPPGIYRTRPTTNVAVRTARKGWALFRTGVLVFLTGVLIAIVVAAIFGGLVIAINGELP
jgi:hypothetical protein